MEFKTGSGWSDFCLELDQFFDSTVNSEKKKKIFPFFLVWIIKQFTLFTFACSHVTIEKWTYKKNVFVYI